MSTVYQMNRWEVNISWRSLLFFSKSVSQLGKRGNVTLNLYLVQWGRQTESSNI